MHDSPSDLFARITDDAPPAPGPVVMERAVVLGGSVAGLLAARVLAEHAEQVLVIERDPAEPDARSAGTGGAVWTRPGVPQGSQLHALLPAGQTQLERWFPGITEEAFAAGARSPDPAQVATWINGQLRPPAEVGDPRPALVTTRPFLESLVRRRVQELDGVTIARGRADGLDWDGDRVVGVRQELVGAGAGGLLSEAADLVVDAMGRASRTENWLADAGFPRPRMQRMGIRLNYASAVFRRDPAISETDVVIAQTVPGGGRVPRIGGVLGVEDDRWIVLVAGYGDDRPSRDADEFRARCREGFPPVFAAIADRGEMLGDVVTYHQADSRRRDYDELDRLPAGLVVAGDAVASFNPVYGQGMTSAALHASCLSGWLRSRPDLTAPARGYFDAVRVVVDAAWQVSTLSDLDLPHVDGPYPRGHKVLSWFGGRLLEASVSDPVLNERLAAVTQMNAHPDALRSPGTVLRTLRSALVGAVRGRE